MSPLLRDRALAAAFLAGTAGCGAILGIDPGVPEDAGGTTRPDGGTAGGRDVSVDVALDVGHLPDGTVAKTIYVSNTAGMDSMSCGLTMVNPCQSISQGVTQATVAGAKTILLAEGTYPGSVELTSVGGFTIQGGVGPQFEPMSSTPAAAATSGSKTRRQLSSGASGINALTIFSL